jgi:hypothetical protein
MLALENAPKKVITRKPAFISVFFETQSDIFQEKIFFGS